MLYYGFYKDDNKELHLMEAEYNTKELFKNDIRKQGYSVQNILSKRQFLEIKCTIKLDKEYERPTVYKKYLGVNWCSQTNLRIIEYIKQVVCNM